MVYYGVFLSAPTVGGNLYLNFFLSSLVELPAIPIGVWIYNRLNKTDVSLLYVICRSVLPHSAKGQRGRVPNYHSVSLNPALTAN